MKNDIYKKINNRLLALEALDVKAVIAKQAEQDLAIAELKAAVFGQLKPVDSLKTNDHQMKILNADKTDYPKIYKTTYWGLRKYEPKNEQIIANRNAFVNDFLIIKNDFFGIAFQTRKSFLDHIEIYTTRNRGMAFINSPYRCEERPESQKELIEKMGFKEIYELYDQHAFTFMKFAQDKNEMKEFIQSIGGIFI